jgi:tripartite-type tricarboxylate transporter receptor subunit TctC
MRFVQTVAAVLPLIVSCAALAQAYPVKPIRVIVPFSAGGAPDMMARMVAQSMSQSIGQPVITENRDGAGGRIGAEAVARAAPDGYTLLLGTTSTHTSPVYLFKSLPYDVTRDFTPITNASEAVHAVVVHPSLPVKSVQDLVDYAKKNPGKLSYGTQGVGSYYHLTGELVNVSEAIDIVHVPFKGVAPAVAALVSNQVQVMYGPVALLVPNAKAGKVNLIALVRRFEGPFPNVPQLGDVLKSFEPLPGWIGYLGPANLPAPIVDRLHTELVKALRQPDVNAKLNQAGLIVVANTPQEFAAEMKRALVAYERIVKAAGIQPE